MLTVFSETRAHVKDIIRFSCLKIEILIGYRSYRPDNKHLSHITYTYAQTV